MDRHELKNKLLNLGIDLAHAKNDDECREIDIKALKAIKDFEKCNETIDPKPGHIEVYGTYPV